jgi:hypothetical protein
MLSREMIMAENDSKSWQFNRQINVSVLVQLVLLASLILGSWVNLQRQLDLLQRDVAMLLQCQKNVEQKLELLWGKSISYEYRLRAIEKQIEQDALPGHAVTFLRFAAIFESIPDFSCFPAKADRDVPVKAAD